MQTPSGHQGTFKEIKDMPYTRKIYLDYKCLTKEPHSEYV